MSAQPIASQEIPPTPSLGELPQSAASACPQTVFERTGYEHAASCQQATQPHESGSKQHGALPFCAYIALGGNMGERFGYLQAALHGLAANPLIRLCTVSAVYETEPVGPVSQGAYLNAVLKVQTSLQPEALLLECQRIETLNGRVRAERFGPRTLDLDILLHSATAHLQAPQLSLPHPRMHERAFVLTPMADIAPQLLLQGKSISEWLALQPQADRLGVRRISEQLHIAQSEQNGGSGSAHCARE